MKSGQILILVLLAVVVVLAVGLSVASRNITNLRTTTQTEQSQRAFSAAEGGVEDVLSKVSGLPVDKILSVEGGNFNIPVGDLTAQVNVKASRVYERPINLGDVAQVNLENFGGNQIKIEWALKDDQIEYLAEGAASVELTLIYGFSPFSQVRWYFGGDARGNSRAETTNSNSNNSCVPSDNFVHCQVVDISGYSSLRILRIKPFWVKTTAKIAGIGQDLDVQIYDVTSTASTEIGVTRRVQVTRTALPQLPAIFDYVLYSEGDIVK